MKTKIFLLLCFLLGMGFNTLSAQNGKDGTGTVQMHFYANEDQYWLPVICNDEIVDYLTGDGKNLEIHGRMHYEGGKMRSLIVTAQGTLESQLKKEVFTIHEQNRIYFDENEIINEFTAHTNAVGNMGTHLIISMIVTDFNSGTYDLIKAMCVPNSDKD